MKYLLMLFCLSLGFHNLVNAQIRDAVPNYLFADDAKIGVTLMFGAMDERVTKNGSVYNKTLHFILEDLKKIGLEPVFSTLATPGWINELETADWISQLDESGVTPNVWLNFNFFKYPKKGDVTRKKLASATLFMRKMPAASEEGTSPPLYKLGNRGGDFALNYTGLFEKLDQQIKQAGPSYFVNKIDDADNEILIPNSDTVNYFPKDLDHEKLVICRFNRHDYYRFNKDKVVDLALAYFKKKYPFELHDCEMLEYEVNSFQKEKIKYLLRVRTFVIYQASGAWYKLTKMPDGHDTVVEVERPGWHSSQDRKAYLVYSIRDLQTGVNYVGKIVASSDYYGAIRIFCNGVKEQFDIK
ncbi:MAG: hypothetical protein JKY52_19670 [Flavobacteriales bacterium]|nr:hypothetical protein [Flavobacteriales bacterium]